MRKSLVLAAVLLLAATVHAQPLIEVTALNASLQPVAGPPSTQTFVRVSSNRTDLFVCGVGQQATASGFTIDLHFAEADACILLPSTQSSILLPYPAAGTYTVRLVGTHIETGVQRVAATTQFDVVDAGPPPQVPALSPLQLAGLAAALVLIALGTLFR